MRARRTAAKLSIVQATVSKTAIPQNTSNSHIYSHFSGRRSGSRYLHPWCDIHSTCVSLHPRYVPLQHHVQIDETDSALAPRICFLQTPSRLCAANNYDIPPAPATPMTSCEQA